MFHLLKARNFIAFCWVPGHRSVSGNEADDDAAAKETAVLGDLLPDQVLGSDVCSFHYHTVLLLWQDEWPWGVGL